jgi:hypothetical protein
MNEVSLRDLMEEKFQALDIRLSELKRAIERLAENTVSVERFESTYHKVGRLERAVEDLDERISKTEGYIGIWRYIGAGIMTVILAILIAWLSGTLGV